MKKHKMLLMAVIGMVLFASVFFMSPFAMAKKHHKSGDQYQPDEAIFTNPEDIDTTYADWMEKNKDILKNMPINQIPLLGSHDSGSCDVSPDSPPCKGYLTHSGHHIHRMPKGSDVTSARCQSASIKDQLRYGVRYLDMRIAWQDGAYWIEHMWMSTPLLGEEGVFAEIKAFLREHPQEVIILHMQELYSETGRMNDDEAEAYFQLIKQEFGAALALKGDFASTTIGDIRAAGANIIVVADVESSSEPFIWYERQVDTKWMNKEDSVELADALNDRVISGWRRGDCADKLRVLQAMTTTKHKIVKARETNAEIKKRLESDWKDAPINVVQVDDSVNSGIMPVLIKRLKQ
ncbi:MAG TPA: hypothetical protein PKY78_03705 [Candidatus Omnitrophota bacterium]|nr:hypothetical protein [Candidatus Omnitrophota bacterium]